MGNSLSIGATLASYVEEILTDTPTRYYQLDIVGAGSNNQTVPDTSGNAEDATLTLSGSTTVWGYPSPIETSGTSKEFFGYTNSADGLVSSISIPNHADLNITGDFSVEAWIRPLADLPIASTFGVVYKQGAYGLMIGWSGGSRLGAFCFDSSSNLYTVFDTQLVTDHLEESFHCVAIRSFNTLQLWVNGVLKATTSISSGLPTLVSGNPAFIGPSTPFALRNRYDEAAFYDYALSEARIIAHYEAAINATLLQGRSNVIPSAILYSDETIAPISFPFRHNWDTPLVERISFLTNISKAVKGGEESQQVRPKPRREIELALLLRDDKERRKFRAKVWANQHAKWFVPIRQYQEQLTAPLVAGASIIPVSTAYKDYEIDGYIGVRQFNALGEIVKSEDLQITAVNDENIGTSTPLVNSYDAYFSFAYPVKRAFLASSIPVRGHTDSVEELTIVARLLAEDEKTVPNRIIPWIPTLNHKGYEIFDPSEWQSNDWSEPRDYDIERAQEDVDFESGIFNVESDTPGAVEAFTYRLWIKGKEQIAAFLGWFYFRAGSWNYLWVPTMQRDFEVISVSSPDITVEGNEYSENYALAEARRDLAFIYADNTVAPRRILGFEAVGSNETLTLEGNVPSLTNLRSVSLLKFCRLDADTLELAWETDDTVKVAFRFREMLVSPDSAGFGLSASASHSPSVSPSASASPSGSMSPSASTSPSASQSPSSSVSASTSFSPSPSASTSPTPSSSVSPSASQSPSASISPSPSRSASPSSSVSPSASVSPSGSASGSASRSASPSSSASPSASVSPS